MNAINCLDTNCRHFSLGIHQTNFVRLYKHIENEDIQENLEKLSKTIQENHSFVFAPPGWEAESLVKTFNESVKSAIMVFGYQLVLQHFSLALPQNGLSCATFSSHGNGELTEGVQFQMSICRTFSKNR
jgi:hypothetical protein